VVQIQPDYEEVGFILEGLRHTIDTLELEFARYAAEFARGLEWEFAGFNTPADWIRINCHMTSSAAWRSLSVGEHENDLEASRQAMCESRIGYAHLAVMAQTRHAVGKAFDESKLLPLAEEHSPGKFYYKCLHYRHSVDAAGYCQEQSDQDLNHHLSLSTAESGHLLINGVLEPVGGAAVRTALEALARPSGAHDDRTREQRLADAAVELASAGRPANLQVTATIETLKGLAGAAAGEMEFSLPISSTAVQRMACDCSVTRVLLSQESVTIDVGRTKRVIDGGLRKALKIRDGYCRWPGCERPASYCDGHHLVHWVDGGPTDLDNVVLLCRRHHRMVHEGGWQLLKVDGKIVTVAPTTTFGSLARAPD
jgi:uncharacterized protein DUF222/HNH endonuclease